MLLVNAKYLAQHKLVGVFVGHHIPDAIACQDKELIGIVPFKYRHIRHRRNLLLLVRQVRPVLELVVPQGPVLAVKGLLRYIAGLHIVLGCGTTECLDTAKFPLTLSDCTNPPAASTRAFSPGLIGLWSSEPGQESG